MKLITEYTESNLECLVEKNDAGEKQYKDSRDICTNRQEE